MVQAHAECFHLSLRLGRRDVVSRARMEETQPKGELCSYASIYYSFSLVPRRAGADVCVLVASPGLVLICSEMPRVERCAVPLKNKVSLPPLSWSVFTVWNSS